MKFIKNVIDLFRFGRLFVSSLNPSALSLHCHGLRTWAIGGYAFLAPG